MHENTTACRKVVVSGMKILLFCRHIYTSYVFIESYVFMHEAATYLLHKK